MRVRDYAERRTEEAKIRARAEAERRAAEEQCAADEAKKRAEAEWQAQAKRRAAEAEQRATEEAKMMQQRLKDNADGTITDSTTGLMWQAAYAFASGEINIL
jgi:membrane protein involved in colicin uptake